MPNTPSLLTSDVQLPQNTAALKFRGTPGGKSLKLITLLLLQSNLAFKIIYRKPL